MAVHGWRSLPVDEFIAGRPAVADISDAPIACVGRGRSNSCPAKPIRRASASERPEEMKA
jgi:hypothetical protein